MPRFFFDIHEDFESYVDETGLDFDDLNCVKKEVQKLLPDLARDELVGDGDRRFFMVLVRNEDGRAIYSATLNYAGVRLSEI